MFGGGIEAFRLYGSVGVDTKPAEQGLDRLSGQVQKSGGIIRNAMGTALGFMGGQYMMSVINQGVGFIKGAAIDYNASMEQASIGFTTLLGSAEKAQAFIADMQDFAAKTPFDFPGLQSAANQMLAMGFASEDILPTLTAVGDAVAALGLGSDAVGRVTMALGQMRSAGRVNAQDMNQLTSVGIPAWQLLADAIGKSIPETRKLSEQGLIPAQTAIDAITQGIESGNMGGMMAAQAKTFKGAMSTISDSMNMALGNALKPFFDVLSAGAQGLANWLSSDDATRFFDGMRDAIQGTFDVLGNLFGLVKDFAAKALKPLGAILRKTAKPIAKVFQGIENAVGTMVAVIGDLLSGDVGLALDDFSEGFGIAKDAVMGVVDVVSQAVGIITNALSNMFGAAKQVLGAVGDLFGALFGGSVKDVGDAVGGVGDAVLNYFTTWLQTWPKALADLGALLWSWIGPAIPMVLDQLAQLGQAILDWLVGAIPPLAAELLNMATAFLAWIGPMIPVFLDELMTWLQSIVDWIADPGIGIIVDNLLKFAQAFIAWVGPAIPPLLLELGKLLAAILVWAITKGVPGLIGAAVKLAGALIGGFIDLLMGKGGQKGLLGLLGDFVVNSLIPGILGFAGQMGKAGLDLAIALGKAFANGLIGLVEGAMNMLVDGVNSIQIHFGGIDLGPLGKIAKIDWWGLRLPHVHLPRLEVGAWDIPKAMVALLHPGEMVVPANFAEGLRGGGGLAPVTISVNIGTFYGTQANIDDLSRSLAERARAARF
jgi:tape measure domain-containing protein